MNAASRELLSVTALRGLASLAVALHHARVDLWVGWAALRQEQVPVSAWDRWIAWLSIPTPFLGSGVILFFLISGFCIALPYAGAQGREFRLGEYFSRRFFRIYPPYLAVIVLGIGVEMIVGGGRLLSSLPSVVASIFMVQNGTTGQMVSNPSLWSLPIEMQLYLLFPLVLIALRRRGLLTVVLGTGLVSLGTLAINLRFGDVLLFSVMTFWLTWVAGLVIAVWVARGQLRKAPGLVLGLGAAVLSFTLAGQVAGVRDALLFVGYGASFFVLLWWAVSREADWYRLPRWIGKALSYLGAISYSLYLIHFPFFKLSGYLWEQYFGSKPVNFLVPVLFTLAAVGIAAVFYRWVEQPSHALAKHMARVLTPRRTETT